MDSGRVEVLTAGGAATPQSGKKKRRNKKKNKKKTPMKEKDGISPSTNPTDVADTTNADPINTDAFAAPISPIPKDENTNHGEDEPNEIEGAFLNSVGQSSTPRSLSAESLDLELEPSERDHIDLLLEPTPSMEEEEEEKVKNEKKIGSRDEKDNMNMRKAMDTVQIEDLYKQPPEEPEESKTNDLFWLFLCFVGIMASFVCYGLLLEYTTSGGRKLHELSFLFVTSGLYTLTAAAGRHVRAETPSTIPPARFAVLGLTSMGSTFCSVRSLR